VAIKVVEKSRLVDPNEAKRMQREIRVMRHLTHPCIVKLFEVSKGGREWGIYIEVG
jgi:5'-AMP-activated protein kinase catalytic alpha subunit